MHKALGSIQRPVLKNIAWFWVVPILPCCSWSNSLISRECYCVNLLSCSLSFFLQSTGFYKNEPVFFSSPSVCVDVYPVTSLCSTVTWRLKAMLSDSELAQIIPPICMGTVWAQNSPLEMVPLKASQPPVVWQETRSLSQLGSGPVVSDDPRLFPSSVAHSHWTEGFLEIHKQLYFSRGLSLVRLPVPTPQS